MKTLNNSSFYLSAYKKYKQTPKGLNWKNKHSQQVRFETIFIMIEKLLSKDVVLVDAGCGFGDFYHFLQKKDVECEYIGIDSIKEFVDIARKNTKQTIYHRDILTDKLIEADIYIASGSLNILSKFETFLFIKRCFLHSKVGFVFNILEGEVHLNFNTFKKDELKEYAKELCADIYLKDGYLSGDVTVFLSHKQ